MNDSTSNLLGDLLLITTIVLTVLKMSGIISISWWLVFLPVIVGVVSTLIIIIIGLLIMYFVTRSKRK